MAEAEVRLRLVVTGDATQAMKRLADATKAAGTEEEQYQRRLRDRVRVIRETERMRGDLERQGVTLGRPGAPPVGQLADQAQARVRQQREVHDELRRRGVVPGPARGPGFGMQAADAAMALGGLNAGLGPAAAAAAAGHSVMQYVRASNEVDTGGLFLSESMRTEQKRRAVPILGSVYGAGRDLGANLTGATDVIRKIRERSALGMIQAEGEGRRDLVRQQMGFQANAADTRASFFAGGAGHGPGLRLTGMGGGQHDRATVLGEKLFAEDRQMLEARKRLRVATVERAGAEETARKAVELVGKVDRDVVRTRRGYDEAVRNRRSMADDPTINKTMSRSFQQALADEELATQRYRDALARQKAAAEQRGQSQEAATAARREQAQARAGAAAAHAGVMEQREQAAVGNARRFGMMGVEGRMEGRLALQLLRQIGVENAPADLIQAASAYAPETVGKMVEGAGEKELGVADRLTGRSGEFRDTDLREVRGQGQKARDERDKSEEDAIREGLAEAGPRIRGIFTSIIDVLMRELETVKSETEQKAMTRNVGSG